MSSVSSFATLRRRVSAVETSSRNARWRSFNSASTVSSFAADWGSPAGAEARASLGGPVDESIPVVSEPGQGAMSGGGREAARGDRPVEALGERRHERVLETLD